MSGLYRHSVGMFRVWGCQNQWWRMKCKREGNMKWKLGLYSGLWMKGCLF